MLKKSNRISKTSGIIVVIFICFLIVITLSFYSPTLAFSIKTKKLESLSSGPTAYSEVMRPKSINPIQESNGGLFIRNIFLENKTESINTLTVIINLFDGTRNPLDENISSNIKIENRWEGKIADRQAKGSNHKFEGLPWHGNGAADVTITISAEGYFPIKRTLPEKIDFGTNVQRADIMLIPVRNEIRAHSWKSLGDCCPDLKRVFSGGTTTESEAQNIYESFTRQKPEVFSNTLAILTLLSNLLQEDKTTLGLEDVCTIDFNSQMSSSKFTIWADPQISQKWKNAASKSRWLYFKQGEPDPWDPTNEDFYLLRWQINSAQGVKNIGGRNCVAVTIYSRPHSNDRYVRMWETNREAGIIFDPAYTLEERRLPTFFEAASDGNLTEIKNYLANGTPIESENEHHLTALEIAANNGKENVVSYLLASGANPNHGAPLLFAARKGYLSILELLLARGALVTQKRDGFSPLLAACEKGHIDIVNRLLKAGSSAREQTTGGVSALELAVNGGHISVLERLLSNGVDSNSLDHSLSPVLITAIKSNQVKAVEILLKNGAKPNFKQGLPLISATAKGYSNIVAILLKNGADPNINTNEDSILLKASFNGFTDCVELLLAYNADPNMANKEGVTPLMAASLLGHSEIIDLLLLKSANVNARTLIGGLTALFFSACEGTPEIIQKLIKAGADRSLRINGKTALEYANKFGNHQAAAVLNHTKVDQLVLQKDFTYFEIGRNPNAIRRELLDSFLLSDSELLKINPSTKEPLNLSEKNKGQINAEMKFMLDSLLKLYNKKRKQIADYLKAKPLNNLSASIEITDNGSAYAGSYPPNNQTNSGSIYIDAKILKANMGASVNNSFTELSSSSDVDRYHKVQELRRQIRNRFIINSRIHRDGVGGFQIPLKNFDELTNVMEQTSAYLELLDLSQKVKEMETQYYGTILFIIAHELGHLALGHHEIINKSPKDCELRKKIEIQADQFSALLLGTSFIVLSMDVIPVQHQVLGKKNLRLLNIEMLNRYIGYSLFFDGAFERLNTQDKGEGCYPSPEDRLKINGLAVKLILDKQRDSLEEKVQQRQDLRDAFQSAFPKRLGLISVLF